MDYLIGAGAILESGENASITPATLHAHVDAALAGRVAVAAIDFESSSPGALRRLVILTAGWNAARFHSEVCEPLRRQGECSLADVLVTLAQAAGAGEVHVFAHWLPDPATYATVRAAGIEITAHPVESIKEASLVCGQRRRHWQAA